jgi:hypothetical protein
MIGASAMRGIEFRGDEGLEDRAQPIGASEDQPGDEAAGDASKKAEERVLQRHGGCDPQIVLVALQTFGEIAVQPAIEDAELGLEAAQHQEIVEYLRRF